MHKDSDTQRLEKAYKLLSIQEGISNNQAKALIDRGLVSVSGTRIEVARALFPKRTRFAVRKIPAVEVIFQDENILALNKPPFLNSHELLHGYSNRGWTLLHRLDRETSGVILLVKEGSEFHQKAKEEFKAQRVYKEYHALVEGQISESMEINAPILVRKGNYALAKVSKNGEKAITFIEPVGYERKWTQLKIIIKTGRTHQIRAHLAHIHHPIIGDTFYGGRVDSRIMLHAHKISLLGYELCALLPKEFLILDSH